MYLLVRFSSCSLRMMRSKERRCQTAAPGVPRNALIRRAENVFSARTTSGNPRRTPGYVTGPQLVGAGFKPARALPFRLGSNGTCTPEDNDPMNTVRHHHERVQPDVRVMVRQPQPTTAYHLRVRVLDHPATRHPTEQGFAMRRAKGDEIRARRRVIVAFQPNAPATGNFGSGRHGRPLSAGCPPSGPCLRCRRVHRVPQVPESPKNTILSGCVEARLVDLDGDSSPTDGGLLGRSWFVTGGLRLPRGAAGSRRRG
jgi:hypothetical protein